MDSFEAIENSGTLRDLAKNLAKLASKKPNDVVYRALLTYCMQNNLRLRHDSNEFADKELTVVNDHTNDVEFMPAGNQDKPKDFNKVGRYVISISNNYVINASQNTPSATTNTKSCLAPNPRSCLSPRSCSTPNVNVNIKSRYTSRPINVEANGLVLDGKTWNVLSYPIIKINPIVSTKVTSDSLKRGVYDITPIRDGTTVTLYFWNGVWYLSSSNGYDISTLKWMGSKTYAELLFDLFTRIYPDFVKTTRVTLENGRLNFGSLSKKYCYTFGFKHYDIHPRISEPESIWQIQHIDLSSFHIYTTSGLPHIPYQLRESFAGTYHDLRLKYLQEPYKYGAILRLSSDAPPDIRIPIEYQNLIDESVMFTDLKNFIYNFTPQEKKLIPAELRVEYKVMKALLIGGEVLMRFEILFPQYRTLLTTYSTFTHDLVNRVGHILSNYMFSNSVYMDEKNPRLAKIIDSFVAYFIAHGFSKDVYNNNMDIKDYVMMPCYAHHYLLAIL